VKTISRKVGREDKKLSKNSLEILKTYSFPGNIRELENMLERAIILAKDDEIEIKVDSTLELEGNDLRAIEKKAIVDALKKLMEIKRKLLNF